MVVVFDRLAADIAHGGSTGTCHFIAALSFIESFLALPAYTNHSLGHPVFNVGSHVCFTLLFYLLAPQRDVAGLLA